MDIVIVKMSQTKKVVVGTQLFTYDRAVQRMPLQRLSLEVFENRVQNIKHERLMQWYTYSILRKARSQGGKTQKVFLS